MPSLFFLFLTFFTITSAQAGEWKFALGGEYISRVTKRGVVLYNSYQVFPIWALDLGTPNLQLVGSSLNYKLANKAETLRWRSRLVPNSTPDRPLFESRGVRQIESRKRTRTAEVDNFFEFHLPELMEIRLEISQDISVHKGTYAEIMSRFILGNWWKKKNGPMIQPALFASSVMGTAAHNEYLYGRGARRSGATNWTWGLLVGSPGAVDTFWPTFQITRFHVIGPAASGSLVEGKKSGTQVLVLAAFRIF